MAQTSCMIHRTQPCLFVTGAVRMAMARITYPRGRVTPNQELCLQQNKEFLLQEMVCQDMVINLRKKYILNANDNDYIVGVSGHRLPQSEQNSRLVDTITMRTPKGFEAFLQALKETGHEEAYNKLKKTLDGVSDGAEPVHTRSKNSSVSEVTIADEKEQEAGQRVQQTTKGVSSGSESLSTKGSELDLYDQLASLSTRVHDIENRMDGLQGQAGQKLTDEQQSEVVLLKEELESAQADMQGLKDARQSRVSKLSAEEKVDKQASERLENAEKTFKELSNRLNKSKAVLKEITDEQHPDVVPLIDELESAGAAMREQKEALQIKINENRREFNKLISVKLGEFEHKIAKLFNRMKQLEEENAGLAARLQAVEQQGAKCCSKIANLERTLTRKQEDQERKLVRQQEDDKTKIDRQLEDFETKIIMLEQFKKQEELARGRIQHQN